MTSSGSWRRKPEGCVEDGRAVGSDPHRPLADGDGHRGPRALGLDYSGDPEKVLPAVILEVLPAGPEADAGSAAGCLRQHLQRDRLRGAIYIVRDIYHKYVNPEASPTELTQASRIVGVGLIVAGVGWPRHGSINPMFTWIMGTSARGWSYPTSCAGTGGG